MFPGTELERQDSEGHRMSRTGFGETVDKVEALPRFSGNERNETGVEKSEKISCKTRKDV